MLEVGFSLGDIQFAGGWAISQTLSHYIQEATAAMTLLSMEHRLAHRLESCLALLNFLEYPPRSSPGELAHRWTLLRRLRC